MPKHVHDFLDCGYDAQQCDSSCRSQHKCGVCGETRDQLAKDIPNVRSHTIDSARLSIKTLQLALRKGKTLVEFVDAIKRCSDQLGGLSREQLVEMAMWRENRS